MRSGQPEAILSKIKSTTGFRSDCSDIFFSELFSISPGSEALFDSTCSRRRMADVLIDLLLAELRADDSTRHRIAEIGARHVEVGVLPLHMKVARQPLMAAVGEACSSLTREEVAEVGLAYDAVVSKMQRAAIGHFA